MRRVTVFTINKTDINTPAYYVDFDYMSLEDHAVCNGLHRGCVVKDGNSYFMDRVPVVRFIDHDGEEKFIAIETELKNFITQEYKEIIVQKDRELFTVKSEFERLNLAVEDWWAQPWYVRVFKSLVRRV